MRSLPDDTIAKKSSDLWDDRKNFVGAEATPLADGEFTGLSKTPARFDNPVKEPRYVSSFRDARTMRQIRDLHANPDFNGDTTLLVTKALFSHTSPFKPWWDESWRPRLPVPARQYRTPAPWRDASDHLKVTFRHVALKTFGPVYSLNLNLSLP
jgi:hypothetical protein